MRALLQGDVAEKVRHRFAVVSSANGLCKDHGDVYHLEEEKNTPLEVHCRSNSNSVSDSAKSLQKHLKLISSPLALFTSCFWFQPVF